MLPLTRLVRDRSMTLDFLLHWTANVVMVALLPVRIGVSGATLWGFLAYAVIVGIVLTLVDDVRNARRIFVRPDVRDYMKVRVAIVVILGVMPFLAGRALAW